MLKEMGTRLRHQVWLKVSPFLESRDEQTELLWQLVANSTRGGNGPKNTPALALTTYSDFATTQPTLFTEAGEPLEADHWLRVIDFKFGLLCCTEVQRCCDVPPLSMND
jgi:hypothetical protein